MSSLFLFLAHQKLLPSFPGSLDVTGVSRFPPRSFLFLVCITYFEFRLWRISGTEKPTTPNKYSWTINVKGVRMALKTAQETSLRYHCLYTQAVAYTTVNPSWSDLDWRSELIRSDFCTCLLLRHWTGSRSRKKKDKGVSFWKWSTKILKPSQPAVKRDSSTKLLLVSQEPSLYVEFKKP